MSEQQEVETPPQEQKRDPVIDVETLLNSMTNDELQAFMSRNGLTIMGQSQSKDKLDMRDVEKYRVLKLYAEIVGEPVTNEDLRNNPFFGFLSRNAMLSQVDKKAAKRLRYLFQAGMAAKLISRPDYRYTHSEEIRDYNRKALMDIILNSSMKGTMLKAVTREEHKEIIEEIGKPSLGERMRGGGTEGRQ